MIGFMSFLLVACSISNDTDDSNNSNANKKENVLGSWEQRTNDNVVGYIEITEDMAIHISAEDGEYGASENYKVTKTDNDTIKLNEANDELIFEGDFKDEDTINLIDFQGVTEEMMDENQFELVRIDNLDEELENFYASIDNQNGTANNNDENIEEESAFENLKILADNSEDTEEIHVTEDLIVGEDEDVKPGVYDLEITGGSGNITGDRSIFNLLSINWVGAAEDNSSDYPSKIRIILVDEDVLSFRDISKVKFNAISEDIESSNELGIGQFIVGIDIDPGEYELSTNVDMDPEFDNLGWDISIYNADIDEARDQTLNPGNDDVMVKLEEGEIITTSYSNTDHGSSSDDAKLIFDEK